MHQPTLLVLFGGLLGGTIVQASPARLPLVPATRQSPETALFVPAGSRMRAQLAEPLSAESVRPGDTIYLRVAAPLVVAGRVVIDRGSFVESTVNRGPERESSGRIALGLRFRRVVSAHGDVADVFTADRTPNDSVYRRGITAVADLPGGDEVVVTTSPIAIVVESAFTVDARGSRASAFGRRVRVVGSTPWLECLVQSVVPTPDTWIPGTPPTPPIGDVPGTPGTPDMLIPGTPSIVESWQPCR